MSGPGLAPVLLAVASTGLLSVLKYVLLAVLWLFFVLVLRAVLTEVRRPGTTAGASASEPLPARASPARVARASQPGPPPRAAPLPRGRPASYAGPSPEAAPPSGSWGASPAPLESDTYAGADWGGQPGPRTGVGSLTVIEPARDAGRAFTVGDEVTLGRAPGCGVSVPDDSFVSSTHARVWRRDGQAWVEDLGSTNGTYLNDRRLEAPTRINQGDRLRVGKTILEATR